MNYTINLYGSELKLEGVESIAYDEEASAYDFLGENDELLAIVPIRNIDTIVKEAK